jgi:hypothetical protein
VPSAFGQIKRIACSDDLNSKYIIFVASMNVDVSSRGAGKFLLTPGRGDVYSIADAASWFDQIGWRMAEHKALAGPASLIVAEAATL